MSLAHRAPPCVKCGTPAFMVHEDSGVTFEAWRCTKCNISRIKKNWLDAVLPFVSIIIISLFMAEGEDADLAAHFLLFEDDSISFGRRTLTFVLAGIVVCLIILICSQVVGK